MVQLSHPYMTTGKSIALIRWTFVGKVMSLLFNMLPRLVIAFFPRSKHLLISWLQSPSSVILEPKSLCVKVTQSCRIHLCDPMDYTVHGIFQARTLKWVGFPFSRGSSQPRNWSQVSCIAGGFFTSWATLCNPMNCSPPGSSVHGILQVRILKWLVMPSSRGSSQPKDQTRVPCIFCIAGGFLTCWAIREAPELAYITTKDLCLRW